MHAEINCLRYIWNNTLLNSNWSAAPLNLNVFQAASLVWKATILYCILLCVFQNSTRPDPHPHRLLESSTNFHACRPMYVRPYSLYVRSMSSARTKSIWASISWYTSGAKTHCSTDTGNLKRVQHATRYILTWCDVRLYWSVSGKNTHQF